MLEIIKNLNHDMLEYNGSSYLLIEKWSHNIVQLVLDYDAVLITTQNTTHFNEIIKNIRTHEASAIFLKPLFYKHEIKTTHTIHTDGLFEEQLSNTLLKNIQQKAAKVHDTKQQNFFDDVKLRTIQFLYTRKGTLQPNKSRTDKLGYLFPFIDLYYDDGNFEKMQLLSTLEREALIQGKLLNRLQLCQKCYDSFLFFKETCPKCSSLEIVSEDVIHHFPCAHVAPISQFKNPENDQLQCPKCEKHLRHIGIDYDRPSSVHTCNSCDHNFQDPAMHAECHSCHHENKLDELIEVSVKNYTLTMKGLLLAEQKSIKTQHQPIDNSQLFNQLIAQEKQRVFASGKSSYKITLDFEGKLFTILNDQFLAQLWNEILGVTAAYVSGKIYQYKKENTIQLLLVDKTENEVQFALQKLVDNLNIILEDNVGKGITITSKYITIKSS